MAKIKFTNVGRGKWCGERDIPNTDMDTILQHAYLEAKKHLASRFPDVEYNAETNKGAILAGYHHAGSFEVISP
jgi:hypothetical protein